MNPSSTVLDHLRSRGLTRRGFLQYCASLAALMGLHHSSVNAMAEALGKARRPSVIWLPFQECTGCTESITRSGSPSIETLIFDLVSLDYQETLMAAAGHAAEEARTLTPVDGYRAAVGARRALLHFRRDTHDLEEAWNQRFEPAACVRECRRAALERTP